MRGLVVLTPEPRILSAEFAEMETHVRRMAPAGPTRDIALRLLASHRALVERVNTLEAALRSVDTYATDAMKQDDRLRALVAITFEARAALGVVPVPDTGKATEGGDKVAVEETL